MSNIIISVLVILIIVESIILLLLAVNKRKTPSNVFNQEVDSIESLLDLIDRSIDLEVAHKLKREITTNSKYVYLTIDNDIAEVSGNVYNNLNQYFMIEYAKHNPIVNNEYWMNYIIKKTTIVLLNATQAINK